MHNSVDSMVTSAAAEHSNIGKPTTHRHKYYYVEVNQNAADQIQGLLAITQKYKNNGKSGDVEKMYSNRFGVGRIASLSVSVAGLQLQLHLNSTTVKQWRQKCGLVCCDCTICDRLGTIICFSSSMTSPYICVSSIFQLQLPTAFPIDLFSNRFVLCVCAIDRNCSLLLDTKTQSVYDMAGVH